jgi:hypothetical protein
MVEQQSGAQQNTATTQPTQPSTHHNQQTLPATFATKLSTIVNAQALQPIKSLVAAAQARLPAGWVLFNVMLRRVLW